MVITEERAGYLLIRPDGPLEARPALMLCPGRTGDIRGLAWLAEPLASRGFLVCGVVYPEDARYLIHDPEQVTAAADWLVGQGLARDGWLGVVGHSRGGAAGLLSAARDARFRAVAALAPLTDNVRYMRALRDYAPTHYQTLLAGRRATPEEDPAYYQAISALRHVEAVRVPILLVHDDRDMLTPHAHSLWFDAALVQAGQAEVRLVLIAGAGHFFERTYHGYAHAEVARLVADWFSRWAG